MAGRMRVGIIGCGVVTQVVHRPVLLSLSEMFVIYACNDAWSEGARQFAASTGSKAWDDPFAMIADESVDVLLIAAPEVFHAEYILAACEAGKKAVLVEKPCTMNVRMAKEVAAVVEKSETAVVVGYPHVYDPAVEQAERLWAGRKPALGEFRTILGPNVDFINDVAHIHRPTTAASTTMQTLTYALAASEPLGTDIGLPDVLSYGVAIGLNIHDIPVMRKLLGEPDEITFAERFSEHGLHVGFRYGTGRVYLTSFLQSEREIDWGFSLRTKDTSVQVRYPTTYAPTASSECTVSKAANGGTERQVWSDSYETGFRREWKHVYELAQAASGNATSIANSVLDLEICEEILKRLRR
ncbi:Predicted dehydrogenase [Halopseudomonas salegens]|uniref:Predicted dehydrogenase n=2 Tax=Halopseudomonas salegens TaxID=1434072 RepID=A0A1H2E4T1_9GAMM|nr:Predicted dehydrogenase [Halopseudomonas salegens]